jgi:limonene-1,2-epoxide hydrolase
VRIHPDAEPRTDAEKAVVGFLDSWGPGAWPHMRDGYDEWLTEDFRWENTGSPPCVGKAAAMVFLTDGTEAIAIPIMGCFTVRDRKIARYADYNADSPIRERFPLHQH